MKILPTFAAALALAFVVIGAFAQSPQAQTSDETPAACAPGEREISATALPEDADAGECRADGRPIVDGAVGALLPSPGKGVYVEALTTRGTQELEIQHLPNGDIELDHVGREPAVEGSADDGQAATLSRAGTRAPSECADRGYSGNDMRVDGGLAYRINWRTTPYEISRVSAIGAIRRAGSSVANTVNNCKMGDRVPAGMAYKGYSATNASVSSTGSCLRNDRLSVVSFGTLRAGVLAVTCNYFSVDPGFNSVGTSDVKINSKNFRWTTNPGSGSCKGAYDLQAVMTHERGHTFGLGHVPERSHPNLTMGPRINGPCQGSERSLGRGDVLGLDRKYP